jgi:hypothetical protein
MAASSPYSDLSDIRLAIIKDAKETTSSTFVALVDRWINEGHEQVIMRKKRDWLDKQYTITVNAATEATCTVTSASTTVTFAGGTTFPSSVELEFNNKAYPEVYNVSSTLSNVVTLSSAYKGDSSTAASGVVFQPSVILDSDIRTVYQAYHQHNDQPLIMVGPQQMRMIQEQGGVQLGYAQYCSIFGQSTSTAGRRLMLYPYPEESYTIYLDTNIFVPELSSSTDEPAIPLQYRQILYWYGLYKLWMYHRNFDMATAALNTFNSMLTRIDGEMRAEIEFPQISVKYLHGRSRRRFKKPFDPRLRDD